MTDTNQASEDELGNILQSLTYNAIKNEIDISKHEYIYNTINKLLPTTKAAIQGLIRTEKLKLLAEVRERVVGEDVPEFHDPGCYQYNGIEYCHCIAKPDKATNNLRNEQRETLTQLEAEL